MIRKLSNHKIWFCLAFITLALIVTIEFIFGRVINGGYEIFVLLYGMFLIEGLTFYVVKIVIFIIMIVCLFGLKYFVWKQNLSWKTFSVLLTVLLLQMIIVLNFEYIYLFTGSSLQQLLFAIYFTLLIFSMAMISIDFRAYKKYFRISR